MNGIMAKIARLAASKAAAFSYAVIAGVAGNIAFNFVERHQPPVIAVAAAPDRTAAAQSARQPPTALSPPSAAAAPALPEVALPGPDALPMPPLHPAMLPPVRQDAAPPPAAPIPAPIAVVHAPPPRRPVATAARPPAGRQDWQLSDLWHPRLAVRKGLGWAGNELPFGSGTASVPQSPRMTPRTAPIPLLPPALAKNDRAPAADATGPGPGSGGLY